MRMPKTPNTIINGKVRQFKIQALWVIKTTWQISPGLLTGIIVTSFLGNLLPAALSWIGREIVNAITDLVRSGEGTGIQSVLPWLILGLVVAIVSELFSSLTSFLKQRLDENLLLRLSMDILKHAAFLDVGQLEDPEMQDIFERVQKNPAGHFSLFLSRMINLFSNIIQMVSLVVILYAVEPLILIVLVPILIPYVYSKWTHSQKAYNKEYSRATKHRWARYFTSTLTGRDSVPEVKILGLAPLLINQYEGLLQGFIAEDRKLFNQRMLMETVYAVILGIASYLLMGRIASQIFFDTLTLGDLTLFITVSARLRSSLSNVAESASNAVAELLYIADLNLFCSVEPQIKRQQESRAMKIKGRVEFKDVSFTYPGSDEEVIHDISFTIEPGETIALVGENGAGKSTLVKLLARLYEPTSGSILIDGLDTRLMDPESLQGQLAFVFQAFNRYQATVFGNIAFGNIAKNPGLADVEQVVEATGIRSLIDSMPLGYQTMLGRHFGAYDLSGGMWQKIALARAFMRDEAALLILDEPTAALDARAEYKLFQQFAELARNRTTILISHRFSTVRLADRIIVLDQGRIIEAGSHEELIELNGQYAELYDLHLRQMEGLT